MTDIILINPGDRIQTYQSLGKDIAAIEPPTFLLIMAAYLRNKGYSVKLYDLPAETKSEDEIADEIVKINPTLVGVFVYGYQPSASTQNMLAARKICQLIKDRSPIKIMLSGTHAAALPERTLREEPVDFVCSRDGFGTTEKLIDKIKFDKQTTDKVNYDDVPSLWYWEFGLPQFNVDGPLLKNAELDEQVPQPAWDLIDFNNYRAHNWHALSNDGIRTPYASMYTTLGCPYNCSFCCINSPFSDLDKPNSYRMWSPENIIKQLEYLVERGVRNIKIVDEMFVLNKKHVIGICDAIIERGLGDKLNIWAYARVDTVKDEFLEKLSKAGFRWLALGIESASKHVRDGANKIYTNDDIKEIVKKIQSYNINVIGNYIFGLPDDTMESMQNTLDLAKELNCEFANFYSAMAYPGSQLYKDALDKGWELPENWNGYSQHAYESFPLRTDALTNAQVLGFRDKAYLDYFTNERYLDMVEKKFGIKQRQDIEEINKIKLKRKVLND